MGTGTASRAGVLADARRGGLREIKIIREKEKDVSGVVDGQGERKGQDCARNDGRARLKEGRTTVPAPFGMEVD